jgi:hypothetical protein
MGLMKVQLTQAERNLGLLWVVATTVGWGIGFFVCEALKPFFYDITHLGGDGLIIGVAIGIAQWLVLRRRIASVGWWWFITSLGFGVGKAAGEAIVQGMPAVIGHALTGAVIGLSVGIAQWLVLRRHVHATEWWLAATIVAWGVGWSLISMVEDAAGLSTLMIYLVGGIGAALAGTITGITLVWLSRPRLA